MHCFIKQYEFFYFLNFCFNYFQIIVTSKEIIEFSEPSNCKNNEYFDGTLFTCIQCDANKNLRPSFDRLTCICNNVSKQNDTKGGNSLCISCDFNTTVTIDGKDCISCNNGVCKCNINEIQIDRNWNGTLLDTIHCLPCQNNTYPSLDRFKCLPCSKFEYDYYINDMYTIRYYTWVQNYCLNKNVSADQLNTNIKSIIEFENKNILSYYFRNELQTATDLCKEKDKVACEHLSNMCALSLYNNKFACELFRQAQVTSTWLFYNKNETIAALYSRKIVQKYSLLKYKNDSTLNFTIATFSLRGKFKSIGTPSMPCNLLENVRFGINFKQKCKLKIKDLLNTNVEFASPYLTFMENKKHVMHTLAILIKNINRNNNEMDHWKLVRKFFFVDNISGFETISNFMGNKVQKADKLSILRYMKSLTVIINIQNVGDKNKIFPPLLIIEYGELTHQQLHEMVEVTLDYTIKFTLTNNNIHFYLKIIIGILVGFAVTFSGLKAWNYSKKHHNSFSNTAVLFWFFIYAIGAVGNVIILTLVILCMYLLMFYKSATSPHILLFGETNDKTIKMFTIVAFIFKLIEILGFICQYWNFKIIFLDWEQPKMTCISSKCDSSDNSMHKLHTHEFRKNMYKSLQMSSKAIINNQKKKIYEANKQNDSENVPVFSEDNKYKVSPSHTERKNSLQEIDKDNSVNNLPVSIWRTYFIANQWLKLQTKRKVSVKVQLLAVSCIFQIIQMYPWILMSEVPNKFSEDNSNFTLYYTVCILTYTIIYCIQWVLFVTFYEQYVTNRMQKFVNLCSIANISVFIYPFNYYGFYIHGRSVHGFADADLPTIMNNLSKEKNNLCAHRGLIPGTTQQTFVLSLTETFKDVFITLSRHTEIKPNNVLKRYYFPTINWEQNFKTQLKLKKFLCKFIDHCFPDVDFIIKEQHFIEKLCNIKFHYNDKKSVFYIDNNYSFSHVLLYGHEWLLATFEMSIFILVIVLMKDCILAAATVTFISMLLVTIVKQNGKNNLNNNVLLNKIFII